MDNGVGGDRLDDMGGCGGLWHDVRAADETKAWARACVGRSLDPGPLYCTGPARNRTRDGSVLGVEVSRRVGLYVLRKDRKGVCACW